MLRCLVAVALVAGVGLPVCAQRGGSMGHAGGFASHGAPAMRGGFAPGGRGSFMGAPRLNGNRFAGAAPNMRMAGRGREAGEFSRRGGYAGQYRYHRPYAPFYGVGLPYNLGYIGPDCLDSFDCGSYGDYSDPAPQQPAAAYPPDGYDPAPMQQAETAPISPYRPTYQRPFPSPEPAPAPSSSSRPAYQRPFLPTPEPAAESAVTLVFKDGRPAEQIHNYMLTRTTLYVQDAQRREIAVADLDLTATEKVNRDSGVEFQLPTGAKSARP
jgi:hypothetical protein